MKSTWHVFTAMCKIDVVGSCCIVVESSAQCSTMIEPGDGEKGGGLEGGAIYILRADSLCSISETNMTL